MEANPTDIFALRDLESYYETQNKVEELYQEPNKWAEYAIHNIAGMGNFRQIFPLKITAT